MDVRSQTFPHTPLFHSVDILGHSTNGISFSFLPENESDTRAFIVGLVPYIQETANPWFMRHFSEDAKLCHLSSCWDPEARQAFSAEDELLDELFAEDLLMQLVQRNQPNLVI